jgi:hypothetical protein
VIGALGILREPPNVELLEKFYHDVISGFIEKGWLKVFIIHIPLFYLLTLLQLQPNNIEVLPGGLAGIAEGLARMQSDQVSKLKLVVHPQETA